MSKLLLSFLIGSILFSACSKENFAPAPDASVLCKLQTANPAGRSYSSGSVVEYTCTEKHCGILPLSAKNYWVYEDSIFNDGVFLKVQFDTLRFSSTKKSMTDGLIWWEGNISIGLPETFYANETDFFSLSDRMFTPDVKDARKEFGIPSGDSIKYLTSFEDAAALGKSVKLQTAVKTPAGVFNNCILFEKNAPYFRKDQVFFKPGIGVIKYIQEKAAPGQRSIKLQRISSLVKIHIE